MTWVLVTGGTGVLGRELVPLLKSSGYTVRVMSRRPASSTPWPDVEWAQADLETGSGLAEAVSDADIVIHAATDSGFTYQGVNLRPLFFPKRDVDVEGTSRLLQEARAAKISHFVYISIVGIDRIPFPYYRHKLLAEELVQESILPWSILRATQFHNLVDTLLQKMAGWPIFFLPTDFQFQPIDPGEVAEQLRKCVADEPGDRLPDIGGPEVLSLRQLAEVWLKARGMRQPIIALPTVGKVAEGFRRGYNTCPTEKYGKVTWGEWVNKRYAEGGESE